MGAAEAHRADLPWGVREIANAIKGKVCVTASGARFTFRSDGRFFYDGLWQSSGGFTFDTGAVVVTFDSGLQRAFEISMRDSVLYMEQTQISCTASQ
jgi:hypothetical protein